MLWPSEDFGREFDAGWSSSYGFVAMAAYDFEDVAAIDVGGAVVGV